MAGGLVYTAVGSEAMATAEYYGKAMCDLGKEHPEIVALTADLAGSTKIGVFRKEFPERFFNVGIAEQNMFGIAARYGEGGPGSLRIHNVRICNHARCRSDSCGYLLSKC